VAEPRDADAGELRRFILEHSPVRGFWIRLDAAWQELRRHQQYAPSVEALLGEAVSASVLLAATLKFHGTLTLQLAGDGLVSLLVAQCTHDFSIRAVARAAAVGGPLSFRELVGSGRVSVTIEADERAARYQGIVALEGANLAQCIENYFETSEQLPTRIALSADGARAAGLLLQKLPPPSELAGATPAVIGEREWQGLQSRVATLDPELLRLGSAEQTLHRVCAEHDCRLFASAPVRFVCRCDAGRVENVLRSLGIEELRGVLAEQGAVTVVCEFCGRPYRFDAVDVERLFAASVSPETPRSIN